MQPSCRKGTNLPPPPPSSSINVTRESNENGQFSARLGLAKLMPGRKIENVVFLGNTEIFEERKHVAFLPLLRPTYMQK